MEKLDRERILSIIPHRHENILIDRIERFKEDDKRKGRGELCFSTEDPLGRDIFLVKNREGDLHYSPFIFMEFVALAAITLMEEKIRQGLTAVFSSIRKVEFDDVVPRAGQPVYGEVVLKKVSKGFHRFEAVVKSLQEDEICSLEIMAYGVDFSEDGSAENEDQGKKADDPLLTVEEKIDKALFAYKRPELIFADAVRNSNSEEQSLTTEYTYPEDHPFTKGHFPDNPVMMGITQVMMVCDALQLAAAKLGRMEETIKGTGRIIKDDGAVVCDIRGIELNPHPNSMPELGKIKNVAFRDLVSPGERLFCMVELQ